MRSKYKFLEYGKEEWQIDQEMIRFAEQNQCIPFYMFREDKAIQNVRALRECMGEQIQIAYSMKANPWLLEVLADVTDYIEVCSRGELQLCRQRGVSGNQIVLGGVYRDLTMMELALAMNVKRLVIDSVMQLDLLLELPQELAKPEVLLRISSGNQFGMDRQDVEYCVQRCQDRKDISLIGIQYYPGSQRRRVWQLKKDAEKLEEWLAYFENEHSFEIQVVEFGLGIGVPCFEEDEMKDFEETVEWISQFVRDLSRRYRIVYEAGRAIAATCGTYVSKVYLEKSRKDGAILYCFGGTNHLQYDGGILGLRTPYLYTISGNKTNKTNVQMICGSLCSEADVLIRNYQCVQEPIGCGDYVCFANTGAYLGTYAPNLFLTMEMPAVLMYNKTMGDCEARIRIQRTCRSTYDLLHDQQDWNREKDKKRQKKDKKRQKKDKKRQKKTERDRNGNRNEYSDTKEDSAGDFSHN